MTKGQPTMAEEITPYKAIQFGLKNLVKESPLSDSQAEQATQNILELALSYSDKPEDMILSYKERCNNFLDTVKKNKGLPVRSIGSENNGDEVVSSENFDQLLPRLEKIQEQVENKYKEQIYIYYKQSLDDFMNAVLGFISELQKEKINIKDAKADIQNLGQDFRTFLRWSRTFNILKTSCFSSEISNAISISSGAIGAEWHYSPQDEQIDYPNFEHIDYDKKVYIIRDCWADGKGFFSSEVTYLDEVSSKLLDLGCSCSLVFLYHLRDIPDSMLSEAGRQKLAEVRQKIRDAGTEIPTFQADKINISSTGIDINNHAASALPSANERENVEISKERRGNGIKGFFQKLFIR